MFSLGCIQAMKCNRNTCPTGVTTHNPRLQRGLDPTDKAVKVANYCRSIVHEVEVMAHSCGVSEPRQLRRYHVRIVGQNGKSVPLDELHPWPQGPEDLSQPSLPAAGAPHQSGGQVPAQP